MSLRKAINDKCRAPDCSNNAGKTKGLCNAHYLRWQRHGRLHSTRMPKGSGTLSEHGYRVVTVDGKQIYEHNLIAEQALGRRLHKGSQVHHVDGDKTNNSPTNLVICPDSKYHRLLHRRQDAYDATGNPDFRKCDKCLKWGDPTTMIRFRRSDGGDRYRHRQKHYQCQENRNG